MKTYRHKTCNTQHCFDSQWSISWFLATLIEVWCTACYVSVQFVSYRPRRCIYGFARCLCSDNSIVGMDCWHEGTSFRLVLANVNVYVTFAICYRRSVCLSFVCRLWRWCTLLSRLKLSAIFSPYDSPGTLVFLCQNSLVGDAPFPLKFSFKVTHPCQTAQFRPISAHSASNVIASEKSSISTYRKSTDHALSNEP